MRELKFRAWDSKANVMHYDFQWMQTKGLDDDDIIDCCAKENENYCEYFDCLPLENLQIMQYTGIKIYDKEVYENDVIEIDERQGNRLLLQGVFKVVWDDKESGWGISWIKGKQADVLSIFDESGSLFYPNLQPFLTRLCMYDDCAIHFAGSIFENPKYSEKAEKKVAEKKEKEICYLESQFGCSGNCYQCLQDYKIGKLRHAAV